MPTRFLILVLTVLLLWPPPGAEAESSGTRRAADGSLVLAGGEVKAPHEGRDSLHLFLSQEVRSYIQLQQGRVWTQRYSWRPSTKFRYRSNPELESLIHKYAQYYGVDPFLVRAVIRHESGFNSQAVSPKGAIGLMQLMPGTADLMGVRDPYDPEENIAGGVGYLRRCLDRFGQSVPLAVAAYNAGPGRVAQAGGIPAIAETQSFVHNVMGTYLGGVPGGSLNQPPPTPSAPPLPREDHKRTPAARKIAAKIQFASNSTTPRPKIIQVRFPSRKQQVSTLQGNE